MSQSTDLASAPPLAPAAKRSPYIASPWYDWIFFLLPPVIALGLGALISGSTFSTKRTWFGGHFVTPAALSLGALINAHLVAVVFRSHFNTRIFKLHPIRFVIVPIALFLGMMVSIWIMAFVTVLVVFWDVYHSGLQTFGLARIYDRNKGNDPSAGRTLDLLLNHLFYAGPIVGGATMLAHFRKFEIFEEVGLPFFSVIPAFMKDNQRYFTWSIVALGTLFIVVYVLSYVRLARRGYRVSPLKVYLLASTGICSIYTWGFNTWGEAFFIMNFFHAVQYLGLVWWSEGESLRKRLRVHGFRLGKLIAAVVFLGLLLTYGVWAQLQTGDEQSLWCITQVVAIMHFWYDGFVWSVRRNQV
jgi:hypothetical protein